VAHNINIAPLKRSRDHENDQHCVFWGLTLDSQVTGSTLNARRKIDAQLCTQGCVEAQPGLHVC